MDSNFRYILVIYFLGSLRDNEGFMVELGGLIQHIYDETGEPRNTHI